ncbi:hypothetical protein [Streptomyces sp. NPDC101393]|uniref:hypothetical protein n=1 Tax=Streptomyces sp. NPDC101393 TaxID=3366141 RepID=UPI003810BE6E
MGRRISAVRALQICLAGRFEATQLYNLAADWDDDETPERETLPEPIPGHGYLIDATARALSPSAALALTAWSEELQGAGACVVITVNQRDWRGDSRFEVPAVRPDAIQVARNHLAERLGSPVQADWLQPGLNRPVSRSLLRGPAAPDPTAGFFSDLITRTVSPTDAIAIAERLHRVKPERLTKAVDQLNDKQNEADAQQQAAREIRAIREEVLLWTDFLESTLAETGTRGQDRVMLLSAAYLEGAPLELCIKAAAEFDPRDEPASRRFREGRSPRRRMRDVGVDVTSDDKAAFESRPGLALSAIRTDWHHWAHERQATREWIERITASGGAAEHWAKQVGERLLELSRTEVDPPFFDVLDHWTTASPLVDPQRIRIVAQLLTRAAQTDELGRDTHKKLLDWVTRPKKNPYQREAVARVCSGSYGQRWPHTALVRLRHILGHDDAATEIAEDALVAHAASGGRGLTHVVETVESWLVKYPGHPAGPRAFLALADPSRPNSVLTSLITIAQASPNIRDFLISGWYTTLEQPEVRERAHHVLVSWAQAVHEDRLSRDFTFGVLTDVRNAHEPVDAMSRFLYGSPDHEDPALIAARFALANLRACTHTQCPRPDCPLTQSPITDDGESSEAVLGEPEH